MGLRIGVGSVDRWMHPPVHQGLCMGLRRVYLGVYSPTYSTPHGIPRGLLYPYEAPSGHPADTPRDHPGLRKGSSGVGRAAIPPNPGYPQAMDPGILGSGPPNTF